jgi:hypothetical protein
MKKDKLSRRDFLKLALSSLGAFLASCMPRVTEEAPVETPVPTASNTPAPSETPSPSATPAPTETPTPTASPTATDIPCFQLLTPEDGAKLPAIGRVTFAWEAMAGAARYQLQFIFPGGQFVFFESDNNRQARYIEAFSAGGTYIWQVVAIDENDLIICSTASFTFDKPETPKPAQDTDQPARDTDQSGGNNDPTPPPPPPPPPPGTPDLGPDQ